MQQHEITKRNDIILEVIYKMSLSPHFIDTPKTINEYIYTLTAIYDQSGSTPANKMRINSSADLIDQLQLRELYTDILIFKCPLP